MKSKEEIQQLAEQDFNDRQECGHYELADLKSRDYYYDGFTNGYNQCQEDMADKKYTEEDVIHLMFNASKWDTFKEGEVGYDMSLSEYIQHCLHKLNKQD